MLKKTKLIILFCSHLITLFLGFGLGVYYLPIIIAEKSSSLQEIKKVEKKANYKTEFKKGQKGNDFFHWGEGQVFISDKFISLEGSISPGPDYKVYLLKNFVEHESEFIPIKSTATFISDLKTFENFIVEVPENININNYNTIIIWCEKFKEFITSAKYK